MKMEIRFLEQYLPNGIRRALDIGCQKGGFTKYLSRLATNIDAIDPSPRNIVDAYQKNCEPNIAYIVGDFPSFPNKHFFDKFNLVTFINSIQRQAEDDIHTCLKKAVFLLKDGGYVYITIDHNTPNITGIDLEHDIPLLLEDAGLSIIESYDDKSNTIWLWQK